MKRSCLVLLIGILLMIVMLSGCLESLISPGSGSGPAGSPGPPGANAGDLYNVPPDCSGGTLNVKIGAIGWDLRGVDNFPSVTVQLAVKDASNNYINNLVPTDFFNVVDEDGVAMWPIDVQRVEGTGKSKKVDIVFVLDSTGSMADQISAVATNISNFADKLSTSGIDFQIGCVTFGDNMGNTGYSTEPRQYFAPTTDVEAFKTFINSIYASGGGDEPENSIDSIDFTRTSLSSGSNPEGSYQKEAGFSYRADAKKIFILITDAPFQSPDYPGDVAYFYTNGGPYNSPVYNTIGDEIMKLNGDDVSVHVVSSSTDYDTYSNLTSGTGGLWFDITGDFSSIIDTIGNAVLNNYIITFMTRNWNTNTYRTVRIATHTAYGFGEATAYYTAPSTIPFMASGYHGYKPTVEPKTDLRPNRKN